MKVSRLTDVIVTCEPPTTWRRETLEERERRLQWWVKDFDDFIRDHRSQDPVRLKVERVHTDVCEFCGDEWETTDDGCPVCCHKAIEEFEAAKVAKES